MSSLTAEERTATSGEGLAAIAASGHTPTDQEHTQFLRRHDQYML